MTTESSDSTTGSAGKEPGIGQEVFGPYIVYERLGVGGMATVHRAREHGIEGFERIVALKRLLPHLAEDASFVKSFVREAKLASLLRHANVVQLYELGRVGTTYFISMEFIDGRDVRRILRQGRKVTGPPTINVTLALLIQLCDALDYAHTRCDDDTGEPLHIVHRDVSPSNLLVTRSGHLKVIDFGIAKAQSNQLRTATGRVKGKLAYMAPEAIAGKELDARSDVFSAGVIAHELLTARPLFASKNEYQTLLKVQKGDILPPSTFNQACPPELDAIVLKALARDPDQRWRSAADMRDALHEVRIRYHVSATNREVASWCEWAFSMEAPGNNFSGPMVTDSLNAMSQSRSPINLPLPAGETDGVPRHNYAHTPPPTVIRAKSHNADEDEAADVAWGGGQEHDSGQPVVLDDVPDHAARGRGTNPGMAGTLAAQHKETSGIHNTLLGIGERTPTGRRTISPAQFPYGSSDDAVGGITPRRRSTHSGMAAPAAPDTEPHDRVDGPSFGAGMLAEQKSGGLKNLIIGGAVAVIAGAALFFAFGRGSSSDKAKTAETSPKEQAPATGKLKFIVEPKDATVRIAGLPPHQGSDWAVDVEAGVFQVEISAEGHKNYVTSIELSAGETQSIRVVLEKGGNPSVATLVLDSSPGGLTVLIDGNEVGKTPFNQEIPPGRHELALRDNGVIKWKETVDASANTKYEFHPDMSETKVRERVAREQRLAVVPERRTAAPRTPVSEAPAVAPEKPVTPPAPAVGSGSGSSEKVVAKTPEPATGSGSAAGSATPPAPKDPKITATVPAPTTTTTTKPPPAPKAPTAAVTVPPGAVKRTKGELGSITTTVHTGDFIPATIPAKVCIDTQGRVTNVTVMGKMSNDLKGRVADAIKGFRYTVYKKDGVATPACFAETFRTK
jgi:serine/threonine protein kinase